jgi:hypothetical protein
VGYPVIARALVAEWPSNASAGDGLGYVDQADLLALTHPLVSQVWCPNPEGYPSTRFIQDQTVIEPFLPEKNLAVVAGREIRCVLLGLLAGSLPSP